MTLSSIASRGTRAGVAAATATALALAPVVAHVVDEAVADSLAQFGLDMTAKVWVIGLVCAAQVLAAFAALRQRRAGYVGVLLFAVGWVIASAVDHYDAFLPGDFRGGLAARVAVWGIVALQGIAAAAAMSALRSTRRTSFSGTGSYT